MALTRGVRNNNPGNIILSSEQWRGKVPNNLNTDVGNPQLEQFYEMVMGVRAMLKNIYAKFRGDTSLTLGEIAYRWNPDPNPANVEAYTSYLEKATGISRDTVMILSEELVKDLAQAFSGIENSGWQIPTDTLNEAYNISGLNLPHSEKKNLKE